MRIVSLLPSATEILFALGACDDLVGVTFECDYPPEARQRRIVSTTTLPEGLTPRQIDTEVRVRMAAGEDLYRLDEGALRDLDPDLVVTQDLCAVCAVDVDDVDAALDHLGCRAEVLTVDPQTLEGVLASIATVGEATGRTDSARGVLSSLRDRLASVAGSVAGRPRPRVTVLEWPDPPFSAGHWVPDMVEAAGAEVALGRSGDRSSQVTWEAIGASRPDVVVMAPCGYGLEDAACQAADVVAAGRLPADAAVWAVDADAAFVRPGPRLVDGIEALAAALHPGAVPPRPDLLRAVHLTERATSRRWFARSGEPVVTRSRKRPATTGE